MQARLESLVALALACGVVGWFLYVILDMGAGIVEHKAVAPPPEAAPSSQAFAAPSRPRPAPVASPSQTSGPVVYKCFVNGAALYSDAPCPGAKLVDATPATHGFNPIRPEPRLVDNVAVPSSEADSISASASAAPNNSMQCEAINKAIEQIDAAARQGGTAAYQDQLRQERHRLVDEKYKLRC